MRGARDVFARYLSDNGIRQSSQRERILDVFLGAEKHLTAIEIYNLARKKYPGIGYATVYRAMKLICKAGLAQEVDFGDGSARFEHKYGHAHHDHIICIECGLCIEVFDSRIEKLQDKLVKKYEFTSLKHKMQIYGICNKCSAKT